MITQKEFLLLHLLDDIKYAQIVEHHGVKLEQLRQWWDDEQGLEIRGTIVKSNRLFNSKAGNPEQTT